MLGSAVVVFRETLEAALLLVLGLALLTGFLVLRQRHRRNP